MASIDLVFEAPPLYTGELVFGDDGGSDVSDAVISGAIALARPTLVGQVALGITASGAITLARPTLTGTVVYYTDTRRPLVAQVAVRYQDAKPETLAMRSRMQDAQALPVGVESRFQGASRLQVATAARFADATQTRSEARVRFQQGTPASRAAVGRYQDATKVHVHRKITFQEALQRNGQLTGIRFQDGLRLRQGGASRFQDARPLHNQTSAHEGYGRQLQTGRTTRYQDAIKPPPGRRVRPGPPVVDPCYVPSGDLVFEAPWSADTNLIFICERHPGPDPEPGETVVVPVRRIYTVINTAQLRRVDGDVLIPNLSMALTIDADSWTWGFTASVPGSALPDLEPTGGVPVELEARINGVAYRAIVEGISRERVFGSSMLSVSGRGKAAVLDAPYSPIMTFDNAGADRTVQQLANDVLTINGASLGWDIDAGWKPDDWVVPAGAWSHQGTYISALNAIAGAAGAYLQPHATAQALSVLKRYPAMPWEWDDVVPDFELPSAVVQKEGIVWTDKPSYNRVVVRGMKHGRQIVATRLGTAGELEAPMVTDQLITNAIGGRQRAIPVLADVGRQAALSLRLPVLPETGIIQPGKFVRFVDGGVTRIGLVRSTDATAVRAEQKLTIWQTIGVETHVGL